MGNNVHILFVDDEPEILSGLKGVLRSMRREWKMFFAENGQAALEILSDQPIDVIVADMRMPAMDGAELLKIVSEKYPHVVRIILSGQANEKAVLKAVRPSHQYLAKPCEPEKLKSVLKRVFNLRELLSDVKLRQLVSEITNLPSLPELYIALDELLRSDDVSIKEVSDIISKDVGMSIKILQLVNSAYFGIPRHVESAAQAVTMLGLNTIKAIVLSTGVFSQFDEKTIKQFSLHKIINHSMITGHYAKKIVSLEVNDQQQAGDALIAGMLHNIGKLIFADKMPDLYANSLSLAIGERMPDWQAEKEVFGTSHAEVGAYLVGQWGLQNNIVEAIAYHHFPSKLSHAHFNTLTAVHVASVLAHQNDSVDSQAGHHQIDDEYLGNLHLSDKLPMWQTSCQETFKKE